MINFDSLTDRPWIVYSLSDPRTKAIRYIGVTFRPAARLREHICRARTGGNTHRDRWLRGLLDLGMKPTVAIVETGIGRAWASAEIACIARHRATGERLLNLTSGGEGNPGYVPTPELRAKWSAIRRGRTYKSERDGGMLGKRHSAEARAKIAAAGTGRTMSAETRAKISARHKGKILAPDHLKKLAEAKRGTTLTPEHRAKIAASTTGRAPVLCVETGTIFASITAAARHCGVTKSTIYQSAKRGVCGGGYHWRRV